MTTKPPVTQDTETLHAKIWKLLDELDEVRSAAPGEGDWRKLNAADDDLRKTLEACEDSETCTADSDLLDWLEEQVKKSFTGVTFTYSKVTVDGQVLEKGYKFMCRHFIGDCRSSLRDAAYAAKAAIESKEQ